MTSMCRYLVLLLVLGLPVVASAQATADDESADPREISARWARQLGHYDPVVRQEAAEALARLAAVEQQKVVQGYQLQLTELLLFDCRCLKLQVCFHQSLL